MAVARPFMCLALLIYADFADLEGKVDFSQFGDMSPTELGFYNDLLHHGPPTAPKTPTLCSQQPLVSMTQLVQGHQQQQQQQTAQQTLHGEQVQHAVMLLTQALLASMPQLPQQLHEQQQQQQQQQSVQQLPHDEQLQHAEALFTQAAVGCAPQLQQQLLEQLQQQQQQLAGEYDRWLQTLWPSWTAAQLEAAQQYAGTLLS